MHFRIGFKLAGRGSGRANTPRWATAAAAVVLLAGCGHRGPARYDVSGTVTYNGQPVPRGYMVFSPDGTRDNKGPGASAEITDGRFTTPQGEGAIGGPHVVSINGFDGNAYQDGPITIPNGKPLFVDMKVNVDLPTAAATHDFHLPDDAAENR